MTKFKYSRKEIAKKLKKAINRKLFISICRENYKEIVKMLLSKAEPESEKEVKCPHNIVGWGEECGRCGRLTTTPLQKPKKIEILETEYSLDLFDLARKINEIAKALNNHLKAK